jgi:hypothetical protein
VREDGPGCHDHAEDVDVKQLDEVVDRLVGDVHVAVDRGVVDQHVDLAELVDGALSGLRHLLLARDVRLDGERTAAGVADELRRRLGVVAALVDGGDRGAFFGKAQRVLAADAARR